MNQDGAPYPKASSDQSSGCPYEDIHHGLSDDSKHISARNTTNLLATCAKTDKGGGVGLNHEIFAIYSTAALPSLWTDILHSSIAGNVSNTIERLHALAKKISASLPIYTSWTDIPPHSSPEHNTLEIHSLTTTLQTSPSTHQSQWTIHRQKPHFLLNASLHDKHCIIGQQSKTETLLVVLRRPWCVLEICVSNSVHDDDVDVLEEIRAFARVAQELDAAGYGTAVFLLGVEIDARRRQGRHHRQMLSRKRDFPAAKVYELCNSTVFLPSLRSFNSFWIRLICVCAIELGVSFSCLVCILCDQRQSPVLRDEQNARHCKSDTAFAGVDIGQYGGRRHSTTELYSSLFRHIAEKEEDGDIVQEMLGLYKHVLRRAGDYI